MPPKKKKTLDDLFESLRNSINRINELAYEHQQTGHDKRMQPIEDIVGRLRPLIAAGSQEITLPLLIHLATITRIPLNIHDITVIPKQPEDENLEIITCLHMGKTWSSKGSEATKKNFSQWLDTRIFLSDITGEWYSRKTLIKDLANSGGMAHFAEKIPHSIDTMERVTVGKTNGDKTTGIAHAILDISEATFWVSQLLLLKYEIYKIIHGTKKVPNRAIAIKKIKESINILNDQHDIKHYKGPCLSVAPIGIKES